MQLFENLKKYYMLSVLFGFLFGLSLILYIKTMSEDNASTDLSLIIILLILSILVGGKVYVKYKKEINEIKRLFHKFKDDSLPHSNTKMVFGQANTPSKKMFFIERLFLVFWAGGIGLSWGCAGIWWYEEKGISVFDKPAAAIVTGIFVICIFAFYMGVFAWDIPYLKKIYEENMPDSEKGDATL